MGDTGSLVCGFIVSILTIQFIEMGLEVGQPFGSSAPSVAVGILFVPLFDTLRVFIVRMMAGRSPFSPDKNHVHHRILAMGFQQISTVILLGLLNVVVILLVINFAYLGNTMLIVMLIALSLLLSVFLACTTAGPSGSAWLPNELKEGAWPVVHRLGSGVAARVAALGHAGR